MSRANRGESSGARPNQGPIVPVVIRPTFFSSTTFSTCRSLTRTRKIREGLTPPKYSASRKYTYFPSRDQLGSPYPKPGTSVHFSVEISKSINLNGRAEVSATTCRPSGESRGANSPLAPDKLETLLVWRSSVYIGVFARPG